MRYFSGLAIAILSVFLCAAVSAATVKLVSGDVLINRGNGFEHDSEGFVRSASG